MGYGRGMLGFIISMLVITPRFGVGAIAISLVGYNSVHMLVTHFWYPPRYFNVKPIHQIFKIMAPPVVAGMMMCFSGRWIIDKIGCTIDYINIFIGVIFGVVIYMSIIMTIYIRPNEVQGLFAKLNKI